MGEEGGLFAQPAAEDMVVISQAHTLFCSHMGSKIWPEPKVLETEVESHFLRQLSVILSTQPKAEVATMPLSSSPRSDTCSNLP